jgi:hypothetical protein
LQALLADKGGRLFAEIDHEYIPVGPLRPLGLLIKSPQRE